jgi:hypothetical protein
LDRYHYELVRHLHQFPAVGDDLVFTGPAGRPLHHGNFRRRVWLPAVTAAGPQPPGGAFLARLMPDEGL